MCFICKNNLKTKIQKRQMSLNEDLVKKIYEKYKGSLTPEATLGHINLQYDAYRELEGTLTQGQFDRLLHKFVEITVDTFSDRTDLPPALKEEWIEAGMPDIRKFVWDKWSREVYKYVNHKDEPRRIFVSLDCITKD